MAMEPPKVMLNAAYRRTLGTDEAQCHLGRILCCASPRKGQHCLPAISMLGTLSGAPPIARGRMRDRAELRSHPGEGTATTTTSGMRSMSVGFAV